jgi:ATP-binding cassette subfamily B protein
VSITIGAGEVVALVGENGSGKTTLAKIIAGLYTPITGTATWDGADYADIGVESVHRQVAAIFQDFVRYQLSALDNIGLGQPEHADDVAAARRAAADAQALDFLDRLPDGLTTLLSREFEGGSDLSGGQWQRVALARALRKDASLIILDEPSAALDPRAEAELFNDIRSMLHGRSALLVSHRLSSVRLADRIYVLREGRIVEHGTHASLVRKDGLYAELYALQAAAYQ